MEQDELEFLRVSNVGFGGPYGWFRRASTNHLVLLNFRTQPEVLDELVRILEESTRDA
jgi:hypothetical protein